MIPFFADATLNYLRRVATGGFVDTAQRLAYTEGGGDYGYGDPPYEPGVSFACLFAAKPAPDTLPGTNVQRVDAELYCGRDVTLSPHDRVTITHLHGEAVATPQTFAIVAGPVVGKSMQVASLQLVVE